MVWSEATKKSGAKFWNAKYIQFNYFFLQTNATFIQAINDAFIA